MSFTDTVARALLDFMPPEKSGAMPMMAGSLRVVGRSAASIDRLPDEILASVFCFASRDHNDPHDDENDPATTPPTSLSHTSRRWRLLALSTPRLWTRIILTYPTSAGQLARALTFLARSKHAPLDILLDLRDPDWDWPLDDFADDGEEMHGLTVEDMHSVFHLLRPCAARWRSVELLTDTWAPLHALLVATQHLGGELKSLESLHLARCNAYLGLPGARFEPRALAVPVPLFGLTSTSSSSSPILPRLRALTLTGTHTVWAALPSALTSLTLKYFAPDVAPTLAHLRSILAACPALEHLALLGCVSGACSTTAAASHADAGPVTLETLSSLELGFPTTCAALFSPKPLFIAPALTSLALEDTARLLGVAHCPSLYLSPVPPHDVLHAPALTALFSALPLARLASLALRGVRAPRAQLAAFVSACAGVRVLRIYDAADEDDEGGALAALSLSAGGADGAAILPALRELELRGGAGGPLAEEVLEALTSRGLEVRCL